MDCPHPDPAIPAPDRDDLDWSAADEHPFYVTDCRDCGQTLEVHFSECDVRPL